MRLNRIAFIFFAIWLLFLGGSAYYALIFPVRVLHHLLMTVVLAAWLLNRLRQGRGLPSTPLNIPLAAAGAVWALSAALSADPRMAFENLWFQLLHILLFLALADSFQRGRDRLVIEIQFLLGAVVLFLSGIELASWFFGLGLLPGAAGGWAAVLGADIPLPLNLPRLSLAMNISTLLAGYAAPLIVFAAIWAWTTSRRDYRIVLAILSAGLLVVTLLTASRGALLSLVTAGGIISGLRLWKTSSIAAQRNLRYLVGAAAAVGILAIVGYTIFSTTQARSTNAGDTGRLDMWRSAIAMAADHPLTGVGPGLFGRAFRTYRDPTIVQDKLAAAHNAYLNTAAETGLPGIVLSVGLAGAFALATYRNWKQTTSPIQQQRIEAAFAALVGLAVHSMVDTFTITPIVLLMSVLAVFCIIPTDLDSRLRPQPASRRITSLAALVLVLGYGLWFIQLDRAQAAFLNSLNADDRSAALESAQAAVDLDPALRLYQLHLADLQAQDTDPAIGISAYRAALSLEPTWDTGWINLAALEFQQGNLQEGGEALAQARAINTHNEAATRWAEWAESQQAAPDDQIITAYQDGIQVNPYLPLADYWWQTPLRREALEYLLPEYPLDQQYRILQAHDPACAAALVPAQPQTGDEWLTSALAALDSGNPEQALTAFDTAIRLLRTSGDAYAGRARARYALHDATGAERDLRVAELLGTFSEYPNAIRAAGEPEAAATLRYRWQVDAVPSKAVGGEFAAVLYGRPAIFTVRPEMRFIGPGRAIMEQWYAIAAERELAGDLPGALHAYQAIVDYAPDETEAQTQIARLGDLSPSP